MSKIVYWNIQQFSIKKINSVSNALTNAGITESVAAQNRAQLLTDILNTAAPDIIVIVEVASSSAGGGDLAPPTGGLNGVSRILDDLRAVNPQWRMVPPLKLTQEKNTETVAVFFLGVSGAGGAQVTRYFTGPNTWTNGANGSSSNAPAAVASNYIGAPYDTFLTPPGMLARPIPLAAQYRGGLVESQSAARIQFLEVPSNKRRSNRNLVGPRNVYWGSTTRVPFMTTFYEVFANGNTRNLTIFSVHTTPGTPAKTFVNNQLPTAVDVATAPINNEIKVICGDFNLNALAADGNSANAYARLTTAPILYTPLINPPALMPGGTNLPAYQGYYATHIRTAPDGAPENTLFMWSEGSNAMQGTTSPYPGYGYVGASEQYPNFFSIDNILLWAGANIVLPPNDFTIINPVVGSPFDYVNPTAGNAPSGTLQFQHQLTALPQNLGVPIAWPQNPAPFFHDAPANFAAALVNWPNYGYIRSTSDHLPLYAVI